MGPARSVTSLITGDLDYNYQIITLLIYMQTQSTKSFVRLATVDRVVVESDRGHWYI